MNEDLTSRKAMLRTEALKARGLLSLSASDHKALLRFFFETVPLKPDHCIAAYWPKGRELDTRLLIDEVIDHGYKVLLPIVEKESRILSFARWHEDSDLIMGRFGVYHPLINSDTEFLEPDIVIVPLLAFDRRGARLGYGGGHYDATLNYLRAKKNILAVGLGYAEQACLFPLPVDDHDAQMDFVITPQGAHIFKERVIV